MAVGSNGHDEERERIVKLLPWHATGRLDEAQSREVEKALRADPRLLETLARIKQEVAASVAANEALGEPAARLLDRLVTQAEADIEAAPRRPALADRVRGWLEALEAFLTPQGLRIAAACAVILVLLQAVFIGFLLSRGTGSPVYETATGGQQQATGPQLLAVFKENTTMAQVSELLAKFHARIIDGPRAGGFYRIGIEREKSSPAGRDELLRTLLESGLAVTALPAGSP